MFIAKLRLGYCSLFVWLLCGCGKNNIQAQNKYVGNAKHQVIPMEATDLSAKDYKIATPLAGRLKDSLDLALQNLVQITGMPGVTAAALIPGQGIWQMNTGFISKPAQIKVDSSTVFYWASVSKLITATIVDQLVGEHRLSYQDKLSQWFPQFDQASNITIEQLINHTSGLASFNTDTNLFSPAKHYTPQEIISIALKQKNLFKPGTYWSYSNTGYLLLSLIAEKMEQLRFDEIVQQRIAQPLHLSSLTVLTEAPPLSNLAQAHNSNGDIVTEDFSVPQGAGSIAANATDMVKLLYSLMSGKLPATSTIHSRLADLFPMFDKGEYYGKGVMLIDFADITNEQDMWIGHTGGTGSYRALLAYDVNTKVFVAVSINAHISVEAVSRKLLRVIGNNL